MASQRIRVLIPTPVEAPRSAEWAANAVIWIWNGASRLARRLRRPAMGQTNGHPVDRERIPHRRQAQ
jgi:hypothetical protein